MPVPEKRKSRNIAKSILRYIETAFEDAYVLTGQVNYRDKTFDVSALDQWVDLDFMENTAGQKGFTMLQVSICSRIQGRVGTGDRYGDAMSILADQFQDAMEVEDIQIYDYSTLAAPVVIAKRKIIVQNSAGIRGQPEENRKMEPVDGISRRVLTYRFITLSDVSRTSRYYD